jgi:hypothetical protein
LAYISAEQDARTDSAFVGADAECGFNEVPSRVIVVPCFAAFRIGMEREDAMLYRTPITPIAAVITLTIMAGGAWAHDESKYPDFSGQWRRVGGTQWDPGKPAGLRQQAPLTPEYQAIYETSLAAQAGGGHGSDLRWTCRTSGMPRIMTAVYPIEIIIEPTTTYILSEYVMPRRIYTDGRTRPELIEPAFAGYSLGKWIDANGDGRYDVLEAETTHFKGPRDFDVDGLPLAKDNETVIKERFFLDQANPDLLHDEITTIDHALTRPWTVTKTYRREKNPIWNEYDCNEANNHVAIGNENYFLSADGYLMPGRKGQQPPDLRYFNQAKN